MFLTRLSLPPNQSSCSYSSTGKSVSEAAPSQATLSWLQHKYIQYVSDLTHPPTPQFSFFFFFFVLPSPDCYWKLFPLTFPFMKAMGPYHMKSWGISLFDLPFFVCLVGPSSRPHPTTPLPNQYMLNPLLFSCVIAIPVPVLTPVFKVSAHPHNIFL